MMATVAACKRLQNKNVTMEPLFEGRMRGKAKRGRKRKHLLNDLMKVKHVVLKNTAEGRKPPHHTLRVRSRGRAPQMDR